MPLIRERLDLITLKELLRLAELKERLAIKSANKDLAEKWFHTAEWFRDLINDK